MNPASAKTHKDVAFRVTSCRYEKPDMLAECQIDIIP